MSRFMPLLPFLTLLAPAQTLIQYGYETIETLSGETDRYRFDAAANDRVLVRLAILSGQLDARVAINGLGGGDSCSEILTTYNPNNPDAPIDSVMELECRMTRSGPVSIEVSGWRGRVNGQYKMFLSRLNSPPEITKFKYGTSGKGEIDNSLVPFRIDGSASDRVLIRLNRTLGQMRPSIRLFDPDGELLCEDARDTALAQINNCLLDKSGPHTLFVSDSQLSGKSNFNIEFMKLNNPIDLEEIRLGETKTGRIDDDIDPYRIQVGPTDRIALRILSDTQGFTPEAQVLDTTGRPLCSVIANSDGVVAFDQCTFSNNTVYTLLVKARHDLGRGDYRIILTRLNQPPNTTQITYGRQAEGSVDRSFDLITFSGKNGDIVNVELQVNSGQMRPEVQLLDPDGTERCIDFNTTGILARINSCRLGFNGLHTLLVKDNADANSGSYHLRLDSSNAQTSDTPVITIAAPTIAETFSTKSPAIPMAGSLFSASPVTSVVWRSGTGASGSATVNAQTNSWEIGQVSLVQGENQITVTARNQLANEGTDVIRVTYQLPTAFEKFLLDSFDSNRDGVVSAAEAATVTEISCAGRNLTSLEGIQIFTNLESLICTNNLLTTLPNLQGLQRLKTLHCQENLLSGLPLLPGSLEEIHCAFNRITTIPNLAGLSTLRNLNASNNQITRVDNLSGWPALETLDLSENDLTSLSELPPTLLNLDCSDNFLATLPPFNQAPFLTKVDLSENNLTSSDCENIQLSGVDLTVCPQLNDPRMACCLTTPKIQISSPGSGTEVSEPRIDVEGTIEEEGELQSVIISTNDFSREVELQSPSPPGIYHWVYRDVPLLRGDNEITVTAKNGGRGIGVGSVKVTYPVDQNEPPIFFDINIKPSALKDDLVPFDARAADFNRDMLSFSWDFGDNNQIRDCSDPKEEIEEDTISWISVCDHVYRVASEYLVSVTVTDGHDSKKEMGVINIFRPNYFPPRITRISASPRETQVGSNIHFSVEATDGDGDPLTYHWVMGDGSYFESLVGEVSYSYNYPESYQVSVTASDGNRDHRLFYSVQISPSDIPAIGVEAKNKGTQWQTQITYEGKAALEKVIEVFNTGTGSLDYSATLMEVNPPTPNWIELSGMVSGTVSGAEGGELAITFPESDELPESSIPYQADIIFEGRGAEPIRRTINLYVTDSVITSKTSPNAFGKMTAEWTTEGARDIGYFLVNVGEEGNLGETRVTETTDTRIALTDLDTNRDYRIQVTPVLKTGGPGTPIELSGRTLPLTPYPYLTRFNHVAKQDNFWTGIAILNPGDHEAKILFQTLGSGGGVLDTSPIRTLPAGKKLLGLLDGFFTGDLTPAVRLVLYSDQPLSTLELFGGQSAAVMSGIPTDDSVGFTAHILAGAGKDGFAGISLVNPSNAAQTRLTIEYLDNQGLLMANRLVTLLPSEKRVFGINDLIDERLKEFSLWARISSKRAVTGFVIWGEEQTQAEGNNGGAFAGSGALEAVLPYRDADSRIYVANPSPANNIVTLSFYKPDGSLETRETVELNAMGRHIIEGRPGSGMLLAKGSHPLLLGSDYRRRRADGGFLSENLPGIVSPGDSFVVPHVASNEQWTTELMLCNVGNSLVDVEIEGYSEIGARLSSTSLPLDAFASTRRSIVQLFGSSSNGQIAWLRIKSVPGAKLAGHLLFYGNDNHAAVMGGVPLTRPQ